MNRKINYRNRQSSLGRQNPFKARIYEIAFGLSGVFRIPLEVHSRKDFGERYFSFSSSLFTLLVFCLYPAFIKFITTNPLHAFDSDETTLWQGILHHGLFYAYLAYTAYVCWLHQVQKKARPSVFDFTLYTKSTGIIDKRIMRIRIGNRYATLREIETIFEPLIFFVPGLVLFFMGQTLGSFLMICSVIDALGYRAAYKNGDDQMMDIIDDYIRQKELINVIVHGRAKAETKGYQFYGDIPNDQEKRYQAAYAMAEDIDYEETK